MGASNTKKKGRRPLWVQVACGYKGAASKKAAQVRPVADWMPEEFAQVQTWLWFPPSLSDCGGHFEIRDRATKLISGEVYKQPFDSGVELWP